MKKFFTVIAMAIAFIGSATKADAQYYNSIQAAISASHELAYDHCRDNVLRGDNEFRRGAYSSAQLYYRRALTDNLDCPGHRYISDAELNRKLDDCQFALTHNGMTRHEYDAQQRLNTQAAIVATIANAAVNRQCDNASVARQMLTGSNNTAELYHYDNNGVSYDANNQYARITKVEKKANATIVHFEYLNINKDISLGIHASTYMKDKATGQDLTLADTDGIYTGTRLHVAAGDSHDFTLTFPAVSKNCHSIDIVDPGDGGWKFYHITI